MKNTTLTLLALFITIFSSLHAQDYVDPMIPLLLAAEREKLPVDGELLYNCEDLSGYTFSPSNGATKKILDAEPDDPFGLKFQLDVKKAGNNAWEPQFQSPRNAIPVNTGDVLLYVFYIRTVDTESPNDFGKADFFAQKASSPWTGIGSLSMSLSTSWKKLYVIAESNAGFATGEMGSTIHLGYLQQQVEIGGILALNLGDVDVDDLPTNDVTYEGMEPDAAWRSEAASRIEAHRKSDISLKVRDGDGNPVENATITIKMKDHAFGFGNFSSDILLDATSDGDKYRSHILEMFNVATTPFYMGGNSDDWGWYGSPTAMKNYPAMAEWMQNNGVPTKGHVLVWPGWNWMPSFFEDLAGDPEGLDAAINEHLDLIVPLGKEKGIDAWDVVNEPFINHDVMDILGEEVLVDWYKRVHEMHGDARLILNEYNIIMGGGRPDFQENFERIITYLQAEGAPLDGIGMQCHFDENLPGISRVIEILDEYEVFGLPIQITEFDVAIRDEQVQADYLRDFYTAVFSHPATEKIVMWGFYEKVMWKPLGALVRSDWSYKPNYDVYMDLLYHQWWTPDSSGLSSESGSFDLRGFNGKYEITAEIGDSVYLFRDRLIENDTILELSPANSSNPVGLGQGFREPEQLLAGYPNPFDDHLILSYSLNQESEVSFDFYSMDGALVDSSSASHSRAGRYSSSFDFSHLSPGIYLCVMEADGPELLRSTIKIVKR